MFRDTNALSNYTGLITLLTEALKLVHHYYRTCSRGSRKILCVQCFFCVCVPTKLKKKGHSTAESSLFFVPLGWGLSPHWFCAALADAAVTQELCVWSPPPDTPSKYWAVWSPCADSCSQQATFYKRFTNVDSASSKIMPVTPAAAMWCNDRFVV